MAAPSASSSSVPPLKKIVKFNEDGKLIGETKKELLKASRRLLNAHISVAYDDWGSIDYTRKDNLFEALQVDFDIPIEYKDSIFDMMADQLRNHKSYIRSKYLSNLTAREISELKDNPPNGIQMAHWNKFVEMETSETKIAERLQNAGSKLLCRNFRKIGVGSASPFPTPEEKVHGLEMGATDRKINVTIMYADKEDAPLYLGSQAHATTIGEMVGNYVI